MPTFLVWRDLGQGIRRARYLSVYLHIKSTARLNDNGLKNAQTSVWRRRIGDALECFKSE